MARGNSRIRTGARGEHLAAEHLRRAGYDVLERNARCGRIGEIDVVASHRGHLVFCEVKTRVLGTTAGPAGPLDAIGTAKRQRIRALAAAWLRTRSPAGCPPGIRFDAIGVTLDRRGALIALDHVEDAF